MRRRHPDRAKGKDPLAPNSAEFAARQARNGHNACHGGVAMGKAWMRVIREKKTTTSGAKLLARQIDGLLNLLGDELKTRID
jgi:hypothetical protein